MNANILKIVCKIKILSQSDLSRMTGISRQAVSLWFKKEGRANIESQNLGKLASALHIKSDDLIVSVPGLDDPKYLNTLQATVLWDHLYRDIYDFLIAVARYHPRALARLVEAYGLFQAAGIVGKKIWKQFPIYKKYLPPIRQKQCEHLWHLQKNLGLI